ncbi:MAG: cell division protein FtsA [Chthoniobacteraceae bacterium]|nr:cell division protein FtsA [Chthoniobacteraceae bacterium]
MAKDQILVGLEIGTSKVCVMVGEAKPDGPIKILGVGQAPSVGIRKGEIVDFENVHKCVREAIADAEDKSDVTIKAVFAGVTGAHIQSFNNRGCVNLPEDREEIDETDCEDVAISARDVNIPQQNAFLHTILQHYYVDGQEGVLNPVAMLGRMLEADFHIVHGVGNRIRNTVRCIKELGIEVEDVVFNGYATAQAILSQQQKDLGALVIDIGGGTTDYVVYVDGAVKQSGVLAVGGDHITNDISMGLRIPMAKSERLKIEEGDATLGNALPGETIFLKAETGFAGRDVEREILNTLIHYRLRETFELLKRAMDGEPYLPMLGAGIVITGGCSQMRGIGPLAQEIFSIPVTVAHSRSTSGLVSAAENPQFSTAIGLLRYGQAAYANRPQKDGFFEKLRGFFGRR